MFLLVVKLCGECSGGGSLRRGAGRGRCVVCSAAFN